jgi:uncharacterized protein (TIGR02646 family)
MRKFTRKPCPSVLLEPFSKKDTKPRWMIYGEKFAKQKNKSKYSYPQINKKKLNHLIFPTLIAQTQNHCSYCDGYPLMSADETIDHFKPKSKHPLEVCNWDNLYVACAHCQKEKLDKDDVLLLRPDKNYKFSKYFFYDYSEHRIEILPQLKGIKLKKAQKTYEILNFNHPGMIESRRISYDGYWDKPKYPRKKLAHRFIFE